MTISQLLWPKSMPEFKHSINISKKYLLFLYRKFFPDILFSFHPQHIFILFLLSDCENMLKTR